MIASLVISPKETISGFRRIYDMRVLRRSIRQGRSFRISTVLWLTAFFALSIAIYCTIDPPVAALVVVPFVGVMMLLVRLAISYAIDKRVRLLPPTVNLDNCQTLRDDQEDRGES